MTHATVWPDPKSADSTTHPTHYSVSGVRDAHLVQQPSRGAISAPPPPIAHATVWRRWLFDAAWVSGTGIVSDCLGAATSLCLRAMLSPAQMGLWQGLKLFLSYANYSNLGVGKGAVREFCVALGRGDEGAGRRGLYLGFAVNTLGSLAYGAVLAAMGCALWYRGDADWGLGLLVVGLLAVVQRHVTYLVTILRGRQQFAVTARLTLCEALVTLVASAGFAWAWGLPGVYLATAIVFLASWAYLQACGAERLSWIWDRQEIARLMRIGAPMLAAGLLTSLYRSLDKWMILCWMSQREYHLGCYSLALMFSAQVYGVGNALATAGAPRYSHHFGRTGQRAEVAQLAARSSELQGALVSLAAGLALVVGSPLAAWLLPAYREGLPALTALLPGIWALVMTLPLYQFLMAVDRQQTTVWLAALGLAAALAADSAVLARGGGLVALATATSASYASYWLAMVWVSVWPDLTSSQRRRYMLTSLLAAMPLVLAWCLARAEWPRLSPAISVLGRGLGVVATWLAVVAWGWRQGGWSAAWRGGSPE